MNPETKVILDELKKQDAKWEQRFTDLDAKWDRKFSERSEAVESCVGALEPRSSWARRPGWRWRRT
jgi:hypothetical protein